jgi:phospholipase/carboxylesterase
VPLHYERNYAYPLLVWLHSPEDGPNQLKTVMPHISLRNYVGAAPGDGSQDDSAASCWPQQADAIVQALDRVEECIRVACRRFHIAERRVFLAGYGSGGTMALRLGVAASERFAGVASLGGPFPQGHRPLAYLPRVRQLPVLIAQGRDSQDYSVRRLCDDLRLFHAAGMSLNLRQYPCGDELTTQMLNDLNVWMMGLVTGTDGSTSTTGDVGLYDDRN